MTKSSEINRAKTSMDVKIRIQHAVYDTKPVAIAPICPAAGLDIVGALNMILREYGKPINICMDKIKVKHANMRAYAMAYYVQPTRRTDCSWSKNSVWKDQFLYVELVLR